MQKEEIFFLSFEWGWGGNNKAISKQWQKRVVFRSLFHARTYLVFQSWRRTEAVVVVVVRSFFPLRVFWSCADEVSDAEAQLLSVSNHHAVQDGDVP
jgi:hypothetical protein